MLPHALTRTTTTISPAVLATVLGLGLAAPVAAVPGAEPPLVARVEAESPSRVELAAMDRAERVRSLARCYPIETETYCLGQGFVEERPDYAVLAAATAPVARTTQRASSTGALGFGEWVEQRAAMSDAERAAADAAEIRQARAGVGKAQALRELEAGERVAARAAAVRPANTIMAGFKVRQRRSYWCGPATMQSIDWADDKRRESQRSWAADLGTTSGGTSISQITRMINAKTRWDAKAGPYIVQSVSTWGPAKFYEVHKRHLGDADPAPIVEHPRLLARHFHYLASDHGGHFQPGRGYYRKRNGTRMIRFYEVFNEADWTLGGRSSWGPREVSSFDMLAATKANSSFRNIGL